MSYRQTRCGCGAALLIVLPLIAGCARESESSSSSTVRAINKPATVRFGGAPDVAVTQDAYVIRSREVGRPLTPELVTGGMFRPPVMTTGDALVGPHPQLVLDLRDNEIAPREDQGAYYVEPQSNALTWSAFTCMNAACTGRGGEGRPFLFVRKIDGIAVGADGRVELSPQASRELLTAPACPACGSNEWTGAYEPPEVAQRRILLEAELAAARREAKRAGGTPSADFRTPMEIMQELSKLPKLYLVPEN
ncbi:MAG: hypothetical protein MI757_16795 [Pirellulales bacterium]|nr:hypothetical protein [Pirellulales bacterium]